MRRIKSACGHAVVGVLVLVTVLAGCAAPALAALQVSNLGQGTAMETMLARWDIEVQGFQTGTHQGGYSLTNVQLHIDSFVAPATIDDMKISLRATQSGFTKPASVDTVIFVNPTFTSAGTYTFTLPTGTTIDLTPETVYYVGIDINNADGDGGGDSGVALGTTITNAIDSGAADGWTIHTASYWDDSGTWTSNGYEYRIAVNATPKIVNTPATGLPTISGTAVAVDDVLTAATSGIMDADGLTSVSYSYQWIQVDDMAMEADISSATSSTYTLVAADVGKHFKVRVTFEDDDDFEESLTSELYPARTGGICARTKQVRDAIMAATAATTCANVTTAHLSGLFPFLNLSGKAITSLQSGDLDGLTHVTRLDLNDNALTSLPADIFDELIRLRNLDLDDNALTSTSLPADSFDELTALTKLDLRGNALTSLPAGLFDELTALTWLDLQENALTSLPAGLFTGLTELTDLYLGNNNLTSLPASLFNGLTALEDLALANNEDLTSLPAGLFTGLTSLDDLNLSYNALRSLPAGIFDGLTELDDLRLNHNALPTLPANIFQDLTTLTTLTLQSNSNTDPFAPTAEAGEPQMVATGATVALAGSSTGPWGTNVTYAWTQTSGTTVTLTGDDTATPSFTAPSTAGDLVFELRVTGRPSASTSNGTARGTDTGTVTVIDPATLATLSDLTLSVGTLDPEFDTEEVTYTASVLNDVTTLTVTPTTTGSNATVEYLDNTDTAITDTDSTTPGLQVALAPNLAETTHVIKVKVTAETGGATKTYTVTVTKEASAVQLPGAPTDLTATPAVEPTQIDLLWTVPDDDGNSPITGYRIEVSTDGNDPWTVLEEDTDNTDTTYAHTGLDPGDARHYRVSARNVVGHGIPSNRDQATTLSGGICARTAQVRNAIVAATSVTTCADVMPAHLASLRGTLDVTSKDITSLKPGDFAGLTNLFDLILERNALTELPAGIFDPLTALNWLRLDGNALTSLPPGIFDKLTALVFLDLSGNALTSLPPGIFDRLTVLETLLLADINTLTSLPPGIFDKLTALTRLNLCGNSLTELELPSFLYDSFITNPPHEL